MKVLFVGEVVGSVGRAMVQRYVPQLRKEYGLDLVICNGENAAHGKGLTRKLYYQLLNCGVDVITMGNHTFAKEDLLKFIEEADRLVRPMNMEPFEVGQSTCVVEVKNLKVAVSNLCGEVFIHTTSDSPFVCMKHILEDYQDCDLHFVDFHAEATSEKIAFTYAFKDVCSAIVGTHTHVQTADERLVDGCAAISDLGMCGPYHSILGRDIDEILIRFTTDEKTRYKIAEGEGIFCGLIVEIDENTRRACAVKRIQIRPEGE